MRRIFAILLGLAVAVVSVGLAPQTATANEDTTDPPRGPVTITTTGRWAGQTTSSGSLDVEASCVAQTTGVVLGTVIEECRLYLNGVPSTNHPSANQNVLPAVSLFQETVTTLTIKLCWKASAIPQLDPLNPVTTTGCTTQTPMVPGGVGQSTEASPGT